MGLPSLTAHPGATAPRKQEADTSRPRCAECQGAERGSFLPSKTSGWSHCSPVWPGCPCCKKTDCVLQQPYKARITTACSETFQNLELAMKLQVTSESFSTFASGAILKNECFCSLMKSHCMFFFLNTESPGNQHVRKADTVPGSPDSVFGSTIKKQAKKNNPFCWHWTLIP